MTGCRACEKPLEFACRAAYSRAMTAGPPKELRRGWTTGACATAALKAALIHLWGGEFPADVGLVLPRGETPRFALARCNSGLDWAEVGIIKDAGDDPDVTHGLEIITRVEPSDGGVVFRGGTGVGTVTKPGLPLAVGEPAINPKPREMMIGVIDDLAETYGRSGDVIVTVSIPGGAEVAQKTWNPRLGIVGGLSVLGTTGVVRPFSCSAWIASIHRGVDVAVALNEPHVAGCTGATSEAVVQKLYDLPDHAMLDMGDFAGGMLKYLRGKPLEKITIGGGIGKLTKLAQGARDLHSARSQVDFAVLDTWVQPDVSGANTVLEAYEIAGPELAQQIAERAGIAARGILGGRAKIDLVVIDRAGKILAQSQTK